MDRGTAWRSGYRAAAQTIVTQMVSAIASQIRGRSLRRRSAERCGKAANAAVLEIDATGAKGEGETMTAEAAGCGRELRATTSGGNCRMASTSGSELVRFSWRFVIARKPTAQQIWQREVAGDVAFSGEIADSTATVQSARP